LTPLTYTRSGPREAPQTELQHLHHSLNTNVSYLRQLLGCDHKVSKVIHRSWWMLSSDYATKLSSVLLLLQRHGLYHQLSVVVAGINV
ncbi:hypothetical protein M8C21_020874, partial [Ambrosia artemisiifolia]